LEADHYSTRRIAALLLLHEVRSGLCLALLFVTAETFAGCAPRIICDMTADGSVWLTVVRLVWAEKKFYGLHGRYGPLVAMTIPTDELPLDVTAGSYAIPIELTKAGYILRANPDSVRAVGPIPRRPDRTHRVRPLQETSRSSPKDGW